MSNKNKANACCLICEQKTNGKMAQCWFCEGWLHYKCLHVDTEETVAFMASDYCTLTCKKCHSKTVDIAKMKYETQQQLTALREEVSAKNQNLSNDVAKLNQDLTAFTTGFNGFKATIQHVEDHLVELQKQVSGVDATLATSSRSTLNYADVVKNIGKKIDQLNAPTSSLHQAATCDKLSLQGAVLSSLSESAQRELRKPNVIVFNMPEEDDDQSDSTKFAEICRQELDLVVSVEKVYRLGKKTNDKAARPLVVRLTEEHSKRQLLLKAKQLRFSTSKTVSCLYIRPDLTKLQQQESKALYTELKAKRRNDSDEWFTIQHGRVVKSDKPKNVQSHRQAITTQAASPQATV